MKYLFAVCAAILLAASAGAQTRSVTNADLNKYAQQRENAEREYRETYARRGFPSPEELERRRKQDAQEMHDYADRIRLQNAEIERAMAAQAAAMQQMSPPVVVVNGQGGYYDPGYFWNGAYYGSGYYGGGNRFGRGFRQYSQPGYYAGGQFWPTGGATPSRPLIQTAPRPIATPRGRH
jgi:hypothetical protein